MGAALRDRKYRLNLVKLEFKDVLPLGHVWISIKINFLVLNVSGLETVRRAGLSFRCSTHLCH